MSANVAPLSVCDGLLEAFLLLPSWLQHFPFSVPCCKMLLPEAVAVCGWTTGLEKVFLALLQLLSLCKRISLRVSKMLTSTPAASWFHLTECVCACCAYLCICVANITGCFSLACSLCQPGNSWCEWLYQILGARVASVGTLCFVLVYFLFCIIKTLLEQKASLSRRPGESSPLLSVTLCSDSNWNKHWETLTWQRINKMRQKMQ